MTPWMIAALLGTFLLLVVCGLALRRIVRRLLERASDRLAVDEFDGGLAIPMRDCDTRRTPRPAAASEPNGRA